MISWTEKEKASEQRELPPAQATPVAILEEHANGARTDGRHAGDFSAAMPRVHKSHWPEGALGLLSTLSGHEKLQFDRLRASLRMHRLDLGCEMTIRGRLRFLLKAPGGWMRHFDSGLDDVAAYLQNVVLAQKGGKK